MAARFPSIALAAISLTFGLCLAWLASLWLLPAEQVTWTRGLAAADPVIGWRPARPGVYHARGIDRHSGSIIYDATYTIDADLMRKTASCATCGTIGFFGDSLTFGTGLEDADTLPQQVADRLPDSRVVNLGLPGSGPQQFLRELETGIFDKAIGPKPALFVYLTGAWMVERSACKAPWVARAPRYVLENGALVRKGICADTNLLPRRLRRTSIYRAFMEPLTRRIGRADVDLDIAILLQAAALAKAKYGVPTLFLFINEDAVTREIAARLTAAGHKTLDLALAVPGLEIEGDGHPTALANRLRAEMIAHSLKSNEAALR